MAAMDAFVNEAIYNINQLGTKSACRFLTNGATTPLAKETII
jgi:hypothetical protein